MTEPSEQAHPDSLEAFKTALSEKLCRLVASGGTLDFSKLSEAERVELQNILRAVIG